MQKNLIKVNESETPHSLTTQIYILTKKNRFKLLVNAEGGKERKKKNFSALKDYIYNARESRTSDWVNN